MIQRSLDVIHRIRARIKWIKQINICTGEIYSETISQFCYPTTDSDVPGPVIFLCYNDGLPTYYPRTRRVYSAGGNKWPQGEKLLFSANSIVPTNAIPEQLIQIV